MRLMAIDPGTKICGFAFFVDGKLDLVTKVEISRGNVITRMNLIIAEWEKLLIAWEPTDVACETWGGERNPGLRTLIQGIKSNCDERKIPWHGCHQSSVMASVRPRGYAARTSEERKAAIVAGVQGLYPVMGMWGPDTQDEYDAVAVGHYCLGKMRERDILEVS